MDFNLGYQWINHKWIRMTRLGNCD